MIEVPEELIERAAIEMGHMLGHAFQSINPPKAGPNTIAMTRRFLAAVLPDLIAAIEGEWEVLPPNKYRDVNAPVFVRRVP